MPVYNQPQGYQQRTTIPQIGNQYYGGQQAMVPQAQPQMQPYQPILPTLSIAPVSGDENAIQFPVAAGTELYLIDRQNNKLYIKSNSANPRDMLKFNLEPIIEAPPQDDTVSRSEFEEMKGMLSQLMTMVKDNNQDQPQNRESDQKNQNRYQKRREHE